MSIPIICRSLNYEYISFLAFGLINNFLFVVILSAALDLVGPSLPKSTILLADVLPALLVKLSAPYCFHRLPYKLRIHSIVVFSMIGLLIVAHSSSLTPKLLGIVLASLSSGIGEVTFLQLCHFYSDIALPGWGVGTGLAGLLGSYTYLALTTFARLSIPHTLQILSITPVFLILVFTFVLPKATYLPLQHNQQLDLSFSDRIHKIRSLIIPFIVPLFLVYFSEYTINQGVDPVLLFPLESTPFSSYRDAYPTYQTIYQFGVLISRSSIYYFTLENIYLPSILQFITLLTLVIQALTQFIPSIWIVFAMTFWEGLLGGVTYVNAIRKVLDTLPFQDREFSVGSVIVGDSLGIVIAGLFSLWLEPALCNWQVDNGIEYCRLSG